jgi:hypothetical protein
MTDPSATSLPQAILWRHGDAPPPRGVARRRHSRFLNLPSSVLLVIGLFLPTLRVCGTPTAPLEVPFVWGPHVIAAIVFAAVLVRPWHLRGFGIALQILIGLNVGVFTIWLPWPIWLAGAAVLLMLFIPARSWEAQAARSGIIAGALSSVWFLLIATDRDALIGAYTSAAASIGLTIGCVWWWIEAWLASRRESDGEVGTYSRVM